MDEYVSCRDIVSKLPIKRGEILYINSDILELAKACKENGERFDCVEFIKTIQDAIGNEGTLLIPTFNWDFCKGIPFDYKKTRSMTGALGNAALKMPEFVRTAHPIYSFAVWGKDRKLLRDMSNVRAWGKDSPFAYMQTNAARAFVIGLAPTIGNTFLHYIEECNGVDYRYEKEFTAPYTDAQGVALQRTYSMYVRDLEADPQHTSFSVLDTIMLQLNVLQTFNINGIPFHFVDLVGMYDIVSLEIRYNNANNLYTFAHRRRKT